MHSSAYVKLHSLLQSASSLKKEEACFLLGNLQSPLLKSLDAKTESFSRLVPIIRTLMDQCFELLQLQQYLPSLPPTNGSPTFYEDFQSFCTTAEWRLFIDKHVRFVLHCTPWKEWVTIHIFSPVIFVSPFPHVLVYCGLGLVWGYFTSLGLLYSI